ncbi:unnamed protein product [Hermetia illucens]|uniref:Farnesol dehydrogenase n=1 Tax=Hermetia illucens TaxID=343691 RepID=A0A7R8YN93_HERIL|nr:farnesol dehydrogenase-like [Hermetia illucens]CAD7079051.1 unnamed protein product [Hermetia illucens]
MDRWQGKVAVVTGASSGIGAVTATKLLENGLSVVALARREERLLENQKTLPENLRARYHPKKCDVTDEEAVKSTFAWIEERFGGADILVNNAGVLTHGVNLSAPDNTEVVRKTVETNIMSVVYCVREAFNSMKKRNVDGHIVIINSVLGHKIPMMPNGSINMYAPSKFAVTAMVETYRQEFANAGTKVKVTSISPGAVETEIVPNMAAYRKAGMSLLYPEDVSNAILYALGTPPHVQVHELIIKPVGEKN